MPTTTRQVRRAAERKAHKAATRPGLRKPSLVPVAPKLGGRGTLNRRLITLTPFGAKVEWMFHFTKGYRSRRVAVS